MSKLGRVRFFFLVVLGLMIAPTIVQATDYSSSNFFVRDPSMGQGGTSNSTSTNFQNRSSIGQNAEGRSTSTNFQGESGFQYYDEATSPTFAQADYRFGEAGSGTAIDYTGAPAENAAGTATSTGDTFRVRLLIRVSTANLSASGQNFKLQFGEMTAADCTSGVSWGDVATGSGVIRYYDGTPADGATITTVAGDPADGGNTNVYQTYEEANNFTNSVAGINNGQDGVWDFSLVNNSAPASKTYCFRATKSDGTVLDSYLFYPQVIIDEHLAFSIDSSSVTFGTIQPGSNPADQTNTLTTTTNATNGYVVYGWSTQALTLGSFTIADWTGTNAAPTTFGAGNFGFGYTTDDSSLTGGTGNRFTNGGAKYAGFTHTGPTPSSNAPVADETAAIQNSAHVINYRLYPSSSQTAQTYTTVIIYVATTNFP